MTYPINTAITAFGMSGRIFHGPALAWHPGFRVRSVLERHHQRSREMLPEATIVRDYDAILNDADIELVIINTPSGLHFDMARAALEHGKHVVVEKPVTVTAAEGDALIALAQQHNRVFTPYQNRRYESGHKTVRALLEQGTLGNIKTFETRIDRWRPGIGTKRWKEDAVPGAGLFYDLGAHLIDEALVLFGWPDALYADIRQQRAATQVDDYFHVILEAGTTKIELKAGFLAREPGPWYVVHGDRGSYVKTTGDIQQSLLDAGIMPESAGWRDETADEWGILHDDDGRRAYPSHKGDYHHFYSQLYDALRGQAPLPVTAHEAVDVIRLIEQAQHSSRHHQRLVLA